MLELRNVGLDVLGEHHIVDANLVLERGSLNVLLGPTLSGKTSLMRLMAGLDRPTSGSVWFGGVDVTGVAVQKRNVAMVYQQFINYPAMTVYENIASPLRIAGKDKGEIDREVRKAAELMRLTGFLDRTPLSLSGGQQQRTALARAIVKNASLVLLDEPLANLDYKLREELRAELPRIFAAAGSIFVYATTEPSEALLLGGHTATLCEGRISQFGRTIDVYRRPLDLVTAKTFADPPLNTMAVVKAGDVFLIGSTSSAGGTAAASQTSVAGQASSATGRQALPVPAHLSHVGDGPVTIGFHPHHLSLKPTVDGSAPLPVTIVISEIAGSESFIHVAFGMERFVMLEHGIHDIEPDSQVPVFLDTRHLMAFGSDGRAILSQPSSLAA